MDDRKGRRLAWALFALYCAVMLWLLLGRDRSYAENDYWEIVRMNLNLEPFHTIRGYLNHLIHYEYFMDRLGETYPYHARQAIINLGGNIGMFIPLGFFLPVLWRKLRKWWRTWLAALLIMTAVELVQLFTLRGSCDVDDLILNVSGAAIGYGIFWLVRKFQKK